MMEEERRGKGSLDPTTDERTDDETKMKLLEYYGGYPLSHVWSNRFGFAFPPSITSASASVLNLSAAICRLHSLAQGALSFVNPLGHCLELASSREGASVMVANPALFPFPTRG